MKNMKLEIYDPPMCCSSGVCGPNVNPELVRFDSDLKWLKSKDVSVARYGLSSQPAAFAGNPEVKKALSEEGNECLPLIMVDGAIVSKGKYPTRQTLAGYFGFEATAVSAPSTGSGCGPECDCNKPLKKSKVKFVIPVIVLLAAAGILGYKLLGPKQTVAKPATEAFAAAPGGNSAADTVLPAKAVPAEQVKAPPAVEKPKTAVQTAAKTVRVGEYLASLGDLNKVAMDKDAVFIVIPIKDDESVAKIIAEAISASQKAIESKGMKIGVYTLSSGSPEYPKIAPQITLPGLIVMSKGRGMAGVQGDITEDKILQAYVASSRAGGCGPSGSSECGPATPGCN